MRYIVRHARGYERGVEWGGRQIRNVHHNLTKTKSPLLSSALKVAKLVREEVKTAPFVIASEAKQSRDVST
jgi:hypothetical protein